MGWFFEFFGVTESARRRASKDQAIILFVRLGNINSGCNVGLEAKREIDAHN
jgi:hypothetical protein